MATETTEEILLLLMGFFEKSVDRSRPYQPTMFVSSAGEVPASYTALISLRGSEAVAYSEELATSMRNSGGKFIKSEITVTKHKLPRLVIVKVNFKFSPKESVKKWALKLERLPQHHDGPQNYWKNVLDNLPTRKESMRSKILAKEKIKKNSEWFINMRRRLRLSSARRSGPRK